MNMDNGFHGLSPTPGNSTPGWLTRRRFIAGALGAALLIACGDDNNDGGRAAVQSTNTAAPGGSTAVQAGSPTPRPSSFPVTLQHKFGSTTIPKEPSRVMTVGYSEQDPVLALGFKPIAVREWFGEQPYATFPWAKDLLGDAKPTVLKMPFGQLDYEAIAALRPDLIIATHSGIKQEEYERLARIAPVVAQPEPYPDFAVPWQEQTRFIGRALGRTERAEQLVASAEAKVTAMAQKHPEFKGRTVAMAATTATSGQYFLYSPDVPPLRLLTSLGFRLTDEIAKTVGSTPNGVQISGEQVRLLDADVLIWYVSSAEQRAAIENDALYSQLRVGREGRSIFLMRWTGSGSGTLTPAQLGFGAFSFSTVLSVPFAVDLMEPMLVAALDGNPATRPTP
jgi:iron complex transport system substrate-binding protein